MILETYNWYHFDIFEQESFQNSCINQPECMRKSFRPDILANVSRVPTWFHWKENWSELAFYWISTYSAFLFWLYSSERKCGILANFVSNSSPFLSILNIWNSTYFRHLEWIALWRFRSKQDSFQDSCINLFGYLKKFLLYRILANFIWYHIYMRY